VSALLLQMKHALVIDGVENSEIQNELGEETKKEFFKDMVKDRPVQSLAEIYGRSDRPATNSVIARYESLVAPKKITLK